MNRFEITITFTPRYEDTLEDKMCILIHSRQTLTFSFKLTNNVINHIKFGLLRNYVSYTSF